MSKGEPHLLEICLKMYDISPWPSLLFEDDVSLTLFERLTLAERIVMSPSMHTKYLTIEFMLMERSILRKDNFMGILQLFLSPYQLRLKKYLKNTFRCPWHNLRV